MMFDGACHGWERASSEILYLYAEWLLASQTLEAKRILTKNLTLLVPIVNTDGFPTHKKNMDFEPPRIDGVDLNRNFDWNWNGIATSGGGVSDDPSSGVYRGPAPMSEPECRVYKEAWRRLRPKHYLNCHIGGNEPIIDGYVRFPTPADKQYQVKVYEEYKQLAQQRGQTVISVTDDGGTGNFNSTPYHAFHIFGWACEFDATNPSYSDLPNLFQSWLPFFITLSHNSEAEITSFLPLLILVGAAYFLIKPKT